MSNPLVNPASRVASKAELNKLVLDVIKSEVSVLPASRIHVLNDIIVQHIGDKALRVVATPLYSTVFEINPKEKSVLQREPSGAYKNPCPDPEFREVRYFCKIVDLSEGIPDWLFPRLGTVFNALAEEGMVGYGSLAPVALLPLASGKQEVIDYEKMQEQDIDEENSYADLKTLPKKIQDMGPPRAAVLWYVGSDYSKEELNEFLGNAAFVDEGELGDSNWDFKKLL